MPVSLSAGAATTHGAVVPIGYAVSNGSSNGITFTNIPQTYQDLMIVVQYRSQVSAATDGLYLYADNVTNGNYSSTWLTGNGTTASSSRIQNDFYGSSVGLVPGANATSGIFAVATTHILNYRNTSTFKTAITRVAADANGSGTTYLTASLLRGTGAITSTGLFVYGGASNLTSGSTATLYGIRSVNQ